MRSIDWYGPDKMYLSAVLKFLAKPSYLVSK